MKPLFFAPDDPELWMGLMERTENLKEVRCLGEYSAGLKYEVKLPSATLIAIVEPEFHECPSMGVPRVWRHLSVSAYRPPRLPSWDELRWCKEVFLGDEKAVMAFPRKAEYVNDHPNVLHLFSGPDGLPDFRSEYSVNGRPSI